MTQTVVVVLAAGAGTRMKSATAKVMHQVAGLPMVSHVLNTAQSLKPDHTVVVVGHDKAQVVEFLEQFHPDVITAVQEQQLGTGDATEVGLKALATSGIKLAADTNVVVLAGDIPLIQPTNLEQLALKSHDAVVLTAIFANPAGYGRIIRSGEFVTAIIEEKDATHEQREILEINSGVYAIKHQHLANHLSKLDVDNAAG